MGAVAGGRAWLALVMEKAKVRHQPQSSMNPTRHLLIQGRSIGRGHWRSPNQQMGSQDTVKSHQKMFEERGEGPNLVNNLGRSALAIDRDCDGLKAMRTTGELLDRIY